MAAGAVSLKYLTKLEEVIKGADQANNQISTSSHESIAFRNFLPSSFFTSFFLYVT